MASITRHGKRWRAQVAVRGVRRSGVFDTRPEAARWAMAQEAELGRARATGKALSDAMARYTKDVCPGHRGARWERLRLALIGRDRVACAPLDSIGPELVAWRDRRLESVTASTVRRELTLLMSVLSAAKSWGWLEEVPKLKKPKEPPARRRRVSSFETEALMAAARYVPGTAPVTSTQRVMVAFLLAMETGMRSGEIASLRPERIKGNVANIVLTKNGDARGVPLNEAAMELLRLLGFRLGVSNVSRDALFRKLVRRAGIANLHFHDSRAEACYRLSKRLNPLELAQVLGHRDLKSLMHYYRTTPEELAARLQGTN